MKMNRREFGLFGAGAMLAVTSLAQAQGKMRGITDKEIRIGQTNPYSGPLSAYAAGYGRVELAYAKMINERGGINGRMINLISLDDGYQPPRTVEQVRRLVEKDDVALIYHIFGTAPNRAVVKYLEGRKIPNLFTGTSGDGFSDPVTQPYTLPLAPTATMEARIYGKYINENLKGRKVGILYQQDEIGESLRKGLREGMGADANMIVKEESYQVTDTTVDSQILSLRAAGVEVIYNSATLKHCAQAAKKMAELGWNPVHFTLNTTTAVSRVLAESGSRLQDGTISSMWHKNPQDKIWDDDPAMKEWRAFMTKYYPEGDQTEPMCVLSTCYMEALVHVLQKCGNNLSGENIMAQATSIVDLQLPLVLPGVLVNTSKTNYNPIQQLQLMKFENGSWVPFGPVWHA